MQEASERHLDFDARPNFGEFSRRYEALLRATDLAARHGFPEFVKGLSQLLTELLKSHVLNYAVHDDRARAMRVYTVDESSHEPTKLEKFQPIESPVGWVWSQQ